jgi:hypothetical protein
MMCAPPDVTKPARYPGVRAQPAAASPAPAGRFRHTPADEPTASVSGSLHHRGPDLTVDGSCGHNRAAHPRTDHVPDTDRAGKAELLADPAMRLIGAGVALNGPVGKADRGRTDPPCLVPTLQSDPADFAGQQTS